MAMTMTQKILAAHAGLSEVVSGQLINAKTDIVLGNDITAPVAIKEFRKIGFDKVYDKDRIVIVLDHFVPNKDIKAAEQSKMCRDFAVQNRISHFYDVGKMGIEHALIPELGIVTAGDCVIGADSHGGGNGDRNGMVQGTICDTNRAQWRSSAFMQRQGPDTQYNRYDWGRRGALQKH